jgi:hypothetical protein
MCPQRFVPASYNNPEKLRVLQEVFDVTWDLVRLSYPNRDASRDDEMRIEIAREIAVQASTGVSEPHVLCKLTLKSLIGRLRSWG